MSHSSRCKTRRENGLAAEKRKEQPHAGHPKPPRERDGNTIVVAPVRNDSSPAYIELDVVRDGEEAMNFLRKNGQFANAPRPDLILLDLNLPKKDGREVLIEIKSDEQLKTIPVVILTTSNAESDIIKTYESAIG